MSVQTDPWEPPFMPRFQDRVSWRPDVIHTGGPSRIYHGDEDKSVKINPAGFTAKIEEES